MKHRTKHSAYNSVEKTRAFWQLRTDRNITEDDAGQIHTNMTGFFSILSVWARKEALKGEGEIPPTTKDLSHAR